MAYTDLVTALKTLAIPVAENAFKSRPEVNTYAVVQLDFEADAFDGCTKLVCTVSEGSYAKKFCEENNISFVLAE